MAGLNLRYQDLRETLMERYCALMSLENPGNLAQSAEYLSWEEKVLIALAAEIRYCTQTGVMWWERSLLEKFCNVL